MIILTSILALIVLVLGYTTFNLLRKVERQEEFVEESDAFVVGLITKIEEATGKLDEIDSKGTFEGDDEVGWFFKSLLEMQEELQSYVTQHASQEESE